MGKMLVEEKAIVVPGEDLAEGMDYLPSYGTYRDRDKVVAARLGLVSLSGRAVKIVPLTGKYNPQKGDTIIGRVIDITIGGWRLDTNSAYSAMLGMKEATSEYIERGADLSKYFRIDDYIVAKVTNVTSQKLVDLSLRGPGLKKLGEGRILKVNPFKVPRIIGKGGSMVKLINDATGCRIIVGQNGIVWMNGEPDMELIATKAIKLVEELAHTSGLTDKVKDILSKKVK